MSINSAMLAGVSGLMANSSSLAAISDNIANVNTNGYKRNQVNFNNLVTSQSVNGRYSAGGVQGQTHSYIGQQGQVQASGSATNIALAGDGLFVVSNGFEGVGAAERSFTRSGSFEPDANGFLVNGAGLYLQGWLADPSTGLFSTSPSDLGLLSAINVKTVGATVRASTGSTIVANLDAERPSTTETAVRIPLEVIDSQGRGRSVVLTLTRDATNNNLWNGVIDTAPTSGQAAGLPRSGNLAFDQNGRIDENPLTSTLFNNAGVYDPSITLAWNAALGVASQTVDLDLSALTQLGGPSTVTSINTNGAGIGQVTGVEISKDGIVTALSDNGETRVLARIAVATFQNPDGLKSQSGNTYSATRDSGAFTLKTAGEGGAGQVAGGALEASTVDLSSEFTSLITTQRAYSASSKIIVTADQMLEELINIKR